MPAFVEARPVNDLLGDPTVFLDLRFGRRAILFDLGDIGRLPERQVTRISDVFVSHRHMDHFIGFDRLLRLILYREKTVRLFGPSGLGDAVAARLSAYSWNLLGPNSANLVIETYDWSGGPVLRPHAFRARSQFVPEPMQEQPVERAVLLDEPEFRIEAVPLDHGVVSLAFALQEKLRANVCRPRLDALGLAPGPWLTRAKHLVRSGASRDTVVDAGSRQLSLAELLDNEVLGTAKGQRIVYATDLAGHESNRERVAALARGADQFFIEVAFRDADRAEARRRKHLTAGEAADIAKRAGVKRAIAIHVSSRYADDPDAVRAEFKESWRRGTR